MSKKNLEVSISSKNSQGSTYWEGIINIPGTRPTKLVRRTNNTTQFATRSAVLTSARVLARSLGYANVTEPSTVRKAAKKSTKAATKAATKKSSK